ncbi:hypothetical protein K1719_024751 [Acacia pycnantha]|nr:hypothetical protein K1719_024751 [Acacia pycnantha]
MITKSRYVKDEDKVCDRATCRLQWRLARPVGRARQCTFDELEDLLEFIYESPRTFLFDRENNRFGQIGHTIKIQMETLVGSAYQRNPFSFARKSRWAIDHHRIRDHCLTRTLSLFILYLFLFLSPSPSSSCSPSPSKSLVGGVLAATLHCFIPLLHWHLPPENPREREGDDGEKERSKKLRREVDGKEKEREEYTTWAPHGLR